MSLQSLYYDIHVINMLFDAVFSTLELYWGLWRILPLVDTFLRKVDLKVNFTTGMTDRAVIESV